MDKKVFPGSVLRIPGRGSGLIKNGFFTTGIDYWTASNAVASFDNVNKRMDITSGGYIRGEITQVIPAGTSITFSFEVDTKGVSSGYADIYEVDSTSTARNWQKIYYTVDGNGQATVNHTWTTSVDTYEFTCNFNHDRPCYVDNVSVFIN